MEELVNITAPMSWQEMTRAQYKWLLKMMAKHPAIERMELMTLAFMKFSGVRVIMIDHTPDPRTGQMYAWVKVNSLVFRVQTESLYSCIRLMAWIADPPGAPWAPYKIAGRRIKEADISQISFGKFIEADNYFETYLKTEDEKYLKAMVKVLVGNRFRARRWELLAVFYWFFSAKESMARQFPNFFVRSAPPDDGLSFMGSVAPSLADRFNAQLRALTKGDITKEDEVLQLPCHRAFSELDAQAREAADLKAKINSKSMFSFN